MRNGKLEERGRKGGKERQSCRTVENEIGMDIYSGMKEEKRLGWNNKESYEQGRKRVAYQRKQAWKWEGWLGAGCLMPSQQPSVSVLWLARGLLPTTVSCLFVKARLSVTEPHHF